MMNRSPNPLVKLRQCHKCGAIDSGLDLTVKTSYEVTAESCEKCGWSSEKFYNELKEAYPDDMVLKFGGQSDK